MQHQNMDSIWKLLPCFPRQICSAQRTASATLVARWFIQAVGTLWDHIDHPAIHYPLCSVSYQAGEGGSGSGSSSSLSEKSSSSDSGTQSSSSCFGAEISSRRLVYSIQHNFVPNHNSLSQDILLTLNPILALGLLFNWSSSFGNIIDAFWFYK